MSTISTPVHLLTNAYVMDGTTLPTPSPGFVESAIKEFIVPTVPGSYTGIPLTTPEHIVGINESIEDGAAAVEATMAQQEALHPGQPFVIFGYSQSTMVISLVKARLEEKKARGEPVPNVTFVGIGGGDWAASSITSRLAGLVVPLIDFRFNYPPPNDPVNGITSIQILRQYDGLGNTAQFVTNPVALANSLLGAIFVHGLYAPEVSLDPDSPKYVPGTIKQQDGNTTYYFIPTADLPLFDPLRFVGVPEGLIDIAEPFFKVLVDAGYDRSVPFSQPTPAQLFPVIDPVTLTIQLAAAVLEGANNAAKLLGFELPGYAALSQQLATAQAWSAAAIGAPYRDEVVAINDSFNPIVAFNQIEGPLGLQFNNVTNALGIPNIANQVLDATLVPVSAWAERNILAPQAGTTPGPFASIARQFLKRVAPHLDATADVSAATDADARGAHVTAATDTPHATADGDSPKTRKPAAEGTNRLTTAADDNWPKLRNPAADDNWPKPRNPAAEGTNKSTTADEESPKPGNRAEPTMKSTTEPDTIAKPSSDVTSPKSAGHQDNGPAAGRSSSNPSSGADK